MNCQATRYDLERFRAAIIQQMGLQFDDARLEFLGGVLQRRLSALGSSSDVYLLGLECEPARGELTALARELTVGETYFFRNNEQFRALAEVVLPERISARRTNRTLRFLSAGCASGEEAYSIAIVLRETIADPSWDVLIRAVDLNPIVLEKAANGRYTSWSLRETPLDVQRRWFHSNGRELLLDESLRAAVKIDAKNLASDDPELWLPDHYDAIFCRNVLMYFSPEQMRAVVGRIANSLAPGGFLFLGHAETLRGVSDRFHLRHTHGTFYYELKDDGDVACSSAAINIPRILPARMPATMLNVMQDDIWVDTIRKATERVTALVPTPGEMNARAAEPACTWDLAPALELLSKERFAEALQHVRARPPAAIDTDVLLLEATLLAHSGQMVVAEDACLRLLLADELNAGAHYVLALCREHSGHLDRAAEHDKVAAYLDPSFAMPRLHLGLLAARAGNREAARCELAQAVVLLRREDASRLLLFGGGFNREALMAVCETALRDNGGRS